MAGRDIFPVRPFCRDAVSTKYIGPPRIVMRFLTKRGGLVGGLQIVAADFLVGLIVANQAAELCPEIEMPAWLPTPSTLGEQVAQRGFAGPSRTEQQDCRTTGRR